MPLPGLAAETGTALAESLPDTLAIREPGLNEPLFPGATGATAGTVRAAIAKAAERTGVDFDYLLAQARIESSLDPSARASTSSAAGLYQFTRDTWLRTLERHGARHGLAWAEGSIENGRLVDPALSGQVLALRHDPDLSALMAGELARDNREALIGTLGREPDAAELYLAHFLGAAGAGEFLAALQSRPETSAAALMPRAAAANRAIFHEPSGAPRSVAGVMELIRGKVSAAMAGEGGGATGFPVAPRLAQGWSPPPVAAGAGAGTGDAGLPGAAPERRSMAETLRSTFGLASAGGTLPASVEKAYGRLRSLGL